MQVHADSSNFAAGVGKKEAYEQVIEQATALFDGQRNWVCIPKNKKIIKQEQSSPENKIKPSPRTNIIHKLLVKS